MTIFTTCTLPPPNTSHKNTVFLDLDNTLIHSTICSVTMPPPKTYDFLFTDSKRVLYVTKRPFVDEFLEYLSMNNYEIVIFTAGDEGYASPILNKLDTKGLISHRLYRNSCYYFAGVLVKDISGLGRDLNNAVIVDDNPSSYRLQRDNGIGIKPFKGNLQDNELKKLIDTFFFECNQYKDLKDALNHYHVAEELKIPNMTKRWTTI